MDYCSLEGQCAPNGRNVEGDAMPEITIRLVSAFILAGMVPLAVLISRDKLRSYRRGVLMARNWMHKHETKKPLPSFVVARIKYELAPCKEEQGAGGSQRLFART